MTKYTMIETRDRNTLCSNINQLIERGWSLHGDTTTTTVVLGNNAVTTYFQALTHPAPTANNTGQI